jgi:hypothetical protein
VPFAGFACRVQVGWPGRISPQCNGIAREKQLSWPAKPARWNLYRDRKSGRGGMFAVGTHQTAWPALRGGMTTFSKKAGAGRIAPAPVSAKRCAASSGDDGRDSSSDDGSRGSDDDADSDGASARWPSVVRAGWAAVAAAGPAVAAVAAYGRLQRPGRTVRTLCQTQR